MTTTFNTRQQLQEVITRHGFLPFFAGEIANFSIEEFCPPHLWFNDDEPGPWEWKGPLIVMGGLAYGKFFGGKAGFITMQWFPDFINYRRDICHLSPDELAVLTVIKQHKSLLSSEVKQLCGYLKPRLRRTANPFQRMMDKEEQAATNQNAAHKREGYETVMTRLQMAGHLLTADFEYRTDRHGRQYGWGIARYCTPEDYFGPEALMTARTPQQSRDRMMNHLASLLPWATPAALTRLLSLNR